MTKRIYALLMMFIMIMIIVFSSLGLASERIVTDMVGREVHLPEQVNKVVTTYKSATEFILALGAADKLVGLPLGGNDDTMLQNLLGGVPNLPEVGSKRKGLNLEQIVALQPDLVVLFPYGDGPEVAERLEQQGIASIIINPESFAEIREANELLGEALGLEEQAQRVAAQFDKIMALARRTEEAESRPEVYFANRQFLDTVGSGMMQTDVIELAGGVNPAAESKAGFIETSPEQLVLWNPDVILVSQFFQEDLHEIVTSPRYQPIGAIREERVYRCPSALQAWDFPGPSSYLLVIWLAEKLHPGLYQDIAIEQVVNDFYSAFYGMGFTELGGKL
ncbi:MAG: ABC transporter substrate-binding protein [Halanaerobium sp.]|nr:ABC transporter substrate-binding protein [Halanaerobium sp.]